MIDEPASLEIVIAQLYRSLQALPTEEKPDTNRMYRSPAYLAIERAIRQHASRHWAITSGIAISERRASDR